MCGGGGLFFIVTRGVGAFDFYLGKNFLQCRELSCLTKKMSCPKWQDHSHWEILLKYVAHYLFSTCRQLKEFVLI